MKHKYLHELFPDGNLPFPYREEDYHDFDKRDTYNLDDSLVSWLYECLRYFQDHAAKIIDFNYRKFNIDGEELTQLQCINRMVDDCAVILKTSSYDREHADKLDAAKNDLFKVLSKVYWAMWW